MSDASLTARLNLDGSGFKKGLDSASDSAKSFSKKFNSELAESRNGIKDVHGTIEGLSKAAEGGIGGAISAVRDFIGLFATNPPLALVAGIVAGATAIIKAYEKAQEKIGEAIAKINEDFKKGQLGFQKAMGLAPDENEIAKRMGLNALGEAKEKLRELRDLQGIAANMAANAQFSPSYGRDERIKKTKEELELVTKEYDDQLKLVNALSEQEKSRNEHAMEAYKKEVEETERRAQEKEREDEAAGKKAAEFEKRVNEMQRKDMEDRAAVELEKQNKLDALGQRSFSSKFQGDSYERVGGQIGRATDPMLRQMDIQRQREDERLRIERESKVALDKITENTAKTSALLAAGDDGK